MNYIGEMLVRHIARRIAVAVLIAAAIGGVVMVVAIELVKR